MSKFLLTTIGICLICLCSCSSKEKTITLDEESISKKKSSKETDIQEFSKYLSYEINRRINVHYSQPQTWDETLLYYFSDLGMLQTGYRIKNTHTPKWKEIEDRMKSEAYEGYIRFSEEDKKAIKSAIESYEEKASIADNQSERSWLIRFYFNSKSGFNNHRKGLIWSYKDAEFGGGCGMLYLAYAYAEGRGVAQDAEESLKWVLLAQFTEGGDRYYAKEILKELETSYTTVPKIFSELKPKAQEKAKAWMQDHPDAFFTPPRSN